MNKEEFKAGLEMLKLPLEHAMTDMQARVAHVLLVRRWPRILTCGVVVTGVQLCPCVCGAPMLCRYVCC